MYHIYTHQKQMVLVALDRITSLNGKKDIHIIIKIIKIFGISESL